MKQVLLDTDAKNEVDDQHYIAYALFSELDVLGINSVHHTRWTENWTNETQTSHTGSETRNYNEILNILDLAKRSGLPDARVPRVFRGATNPLKAPSSDRWCDTTPIITAASNAMLAAARGASPENPVWLLPVGPATNLASALLQVRQEGWETEFRKRIRVIWLGGAEESPTPDRDYNGANDRWSVYVTAQSGIDFTILLAIPTGASLRANVLVEGHLWPNNPLGNYLRSIMPTRSDRANAAMFDVAVIAEVIGNHLGTSWLTRVDSLMVVQGPAQGFRWARVDSPTNVRIVREINTTAMKKDLFDTLNGRPSRLIGSAPSAPPSNTLGLVDGSGTRQQANSLDAVRFVAESSFTADTMQARFTNNSASSAMRMAICADNDGNPGTVLGDTAQFDAGPGLRTAALKTPVEITDGNVYWIATWVQSGGSETTNVTFVANDGAGTRYRAEPAYSATASFPSGSTLSYSANVTYAVSATGTED